MSLDITEVKVLKMKLFELLEKDATTAGPNIALGAASLLVQLAQIPTVPFQEESLQVLKEIKDGMKEGLAMEKEEKKKEDESKAD